MKTESFNKYRVTIEYWSEAHGQDVQVFVDVIAKSTQEALETAEIENVGAKALSADMVQMDLPEAEVRCYTK